MIRLLFGVVALVFWASGAFAQGEQSIGDVERDHLVEELATAIADEYFDEDTATEIASALRMQNDNGAFDEAVSRIEFSQALTEYLKAYDRHFAVRYVGREEVAEMMSNTGGEGGGDHDHSAGAQRRNFGFQEVSILPGNIGYIDLRSFDPIQDADATATAALDFVANTDAVIFDVRQNGGGEPSMVQFLISHFLDNRESVAINTFVSRHTEYPAQLNSLLDLPSISRPDVPVFVLISGRTGSAAEAFAYHLQAMERATIVGETSYGAGNPGGHFLLDEGYSIFISTGSARNPITLTNWEGTGVAPDIAVAADAALDSAMIAALDQLIANSDDELRQREWTWAKEILAQGQETYAMDEAALTEYVGDYGPRHIVMQNSAIHYRRDEQPSRALVPLGEDRFLLDGLDAYRLTFLRNRRGVIISLSLEQLNGPGSVSERD